MTLKRVWQSGSDPSSGLKAWIKGRTQTQTKEKKEKMKTLPAILVGLLAYLAVGVSTGRGQVMYAPEPTAIATGTPPPGVIETYKVVNGMNIQATVYNVDDGQRHRVVIAIHGGVYSV